MIDREEEREGVTSRRGGWSPNERGFVPLIPGDDWNSISALERFWPGRRPQRFLEVVLKRCWSPAPTPLAFIATRPRVTSAALICNRIIEYFTLLLFFCSTIFFSFYFFQRFEIYRGTNKLFSSFQNFPSLFLTEEKRICRDRLWIFLSSDERRQILFSFFLFSLSIEAWEYSRGHQRRNRWLVPAKIDPSRSIHDRSWFYLNLRW